VTGTDVMSDVVRMLSVAAGCWLISLSDSLSL
jgi:hypothetical protein